MARTTIADAMNGVKKGKAPSQKKSHHSKRKKEAEKYRDSWRGFKLWCEEKACIPIYPEGSDIAEWFPVGELPTEPHPETGKSYRHIWEQQLEICKEALRMENSRFVYNLIIFCWMRGEGKSLLACLIELWKFFNWPNQKIMLGANSKEQTKFVHYDIMRDIVLNSPKLLEDIGGKRNIQEKELRIRDEKGDIMSIVRSISSFSGIVSNITGFTFSEIFDMKNPKFYVQLYGSIRNVPNALGVIDSTVSEKTHTLFLLFDRVMKKKTKKVFFSYRCAPKGIPDEFWNPIMTEDQLNDYKETFPFGEYERYFQNLWSAGQKQIFSDAMIDETELLGIDGGLLNHADIVAELGKKYDVLNRQKDLEATGKRKEEILNLLDGSQIIDGIEKRFSRVSDYYTLRGKYSENSYCSIEQLLKLGEMLDTDWAILSGTDFGDPYAVTGLARSILTIIAKGLPGSKSNPYKFLSEEASPKYIYFLLRFFNVEEHSLSVVKGYLDDAHTEYDGIDTFCSERHGVWDMEKWCEERDIVFEPVYPSYERQRMAFKELLLAVKFGLFKKPLLAVPGSKKDDIMREEMEVFMHDSGRHWFGSPQKEEKHGIQDDTIFSNGWTLYGGRTLGVEDFRIRKAHGISFGSFYSTKDLVGLY